MMLLVQKLRLRGRALHAKRPPPSLRHCRDPSSAVIESRGSNGITEALGGAHAIRNFEPQPSNQSDRRSMLARPHALLCALEHIQPRSQREDRPLTLSDKTTN